MKCIRQGSEIRGQGSGKAGARDVGIRDWKNRKQRLEVLFRLEEPFGGTLGDLVDSEGKGCG